ncbi:hypothetical protein GCM10010320_56800 [Streptomyces caelestis]|nr:hypothetical protein GCM10010320_56800 [Streptomyces caelestis]
MVSPGVSYESGELQSMTSFVLLRTAIGTPWALITLSGFARCGRVYDADALQVFSGVQLPAVGAGGRGGVCAVGPGGRDDGVRGRGSKPGFLPHRPEVRGRSPR